MAFELSVPDPSDTRVLPEAYERIGRFVLDATSGSFLVRYDLYASEDAWLAGKPALRSRERAIRPVGTPAVRDEAGNLIYPAIPSFAALMGDPANAAAFGAVKARLYLLERAFPEAAGAADA